MSLLRSSENSSVRPTRGLREADWKQRHWDRVCCRTSSSWRTGSRGTGTEYVVEPVHRGGLEAEALGQSMLSNQFIVGLRPELKTKMVGMEGSFEELLMKSRFEEAKNHEVAAVKNSSGHPQSVWAKKPGGPTSDEKRKPLGKPNGPKGTMNAVPEETSPATGLKFSKSRKCFNCGMERHMARACTYPRQTRGDHEARGRRNPGTGK